MIPVPPKRLLLADVPRYIRTQYGNDVSRRTIFNWVEYGRKGEKLKVITVNDRYKRWGREDQRMTTTQWVDEFLLKVTDFR